MRLGLFLLTLLIALSALATDAPRTLTVGKAPTSGGEARLALVIGNGMYKEGALRNPPQDARLMAKTLRGLGFDVIERINADQKTMRRAVSDFGQKLEQAGGNAVGMVYYAGHGIQSQGRNFLIPVNAEIRGEADLKIEAVEAAEILGTMDVAKARLNFVVLDACRNNPFARSFRSANRGLARMDAPEGTLIAYATRPGDVAADGDGANSPYTTALAKALTTPGLPVTELFIQVRNEVIAATGRKQTPWEEGGLTAQYFFAGPGDGNRPALATPAAPTPAAPITEDLYWQSIMGSQDAADFDAYLKKYPKGKFSDLAKNRLKAAKDAMAPPKVATISPSKTQAFLSLPPTKQTLSAEVKRALDIALDSARSEENQSHRSSDLRKVAVAMAKLGQAREALPLLPEIERGVAALEGQKRLEAEAEISIIQARSGDFQGATQRFGRVWDAATKLTGDDRGTALSDLVEKRFAWGDTASLAQFKASLTEPALRESYQSALAKSLIEAGDYSGGLAAIESFAPTNKTWLQGQVVFRLLKQGDAAEALRVAETIVDPQEYSWRVREVAEHILKQGPNPDVLKGLERAAQTIDMTKHSLAGQNIGKIAAVFARGGDMASARKWAERAVNHARNQTWIMRNIGLEMAYEAYIALGETSAADRLLQIAEPNEREKCRAGFAYQLARAGNAAAASQMVQSIKDEFWRDTATERIAEALVERDEVAAALRTANGIGSASTRSGALLKVARALVQKERFDEVFRLLPSLSPSYRASVAIDLAKAIAENARQVRRS